jgi:hypothetical protein
MKFSDEEIRNILELKEEMTEKIVKCQEQIEKLEKSLSAVDTILKQSSFTKASEIISNSSDTKKEENRVSIPITKSSDGTIIANVFVSDDKVSIILEENVILSSETPPLKTFFIERIIGEMKKKDGQEVQSGKIGRDDVIDCVINNSGSAIREIIIKNYRQKERVDEIINSAKWSLTRMIENSE